MKAPPTAARGAACRAVAYTITLLDKFEIASSRIISPATLSALQHGNKAESSFLVQSFRKDVMEDLCTCPKEDFP